MIAEIERLENDTSNLEARLRRAENETELLKLRLGWSSLLVGFLGGLVPVLIVIGVALVQRWWK